MNKSSRSIIGSVLFIDYQAGHVRHVHTRTQIRRWVKVLGFLGVIAPAGPHAVDGAREIIKVKVLWHVGMAEGGCSQGTSFGLCGLRARRAPLLYFKVKTETHVLKSVRMNIPSPSTAVENRGGSTGICYMFQCSYFTNWLVAWLKIGSGDWCGVSV